MKTIISSLFVLIPTLAFTQNKVRLEQHYLNREIINPSNTLDVGYGNQHTVVAFSSDLNTNGFIHAFHSSAGRKSLYSTTLISEQERKELTFNYIRLFSKRFYRDDKNIGWKSFSPSMSINVIYDDNKIKLNQTFAFKFHRHTEIYRPKRRLVGEFSANNIWSNNRLIYTGGQIMLLEYISNSHSPRLAFLKQPSLKLLGNSFYTNDLNAEIGPELILGKKQMLISYLINSNSSHILLTSFRVRQFYIGSKYIIRENNTNELSFSIRLEVGAFVFVSTETHHHR